MRNIRFFAYLICLVYILTLVGCSCEKENKGRPVTYIIANDDIEKKGFQVMDKVVIKSRQQLRYDLFMTETATNYSVLVDEYISTDDALYSMSIIKKDKSQELINDGSVVYDPQGNTYTIDISEDYVDVKNSICLRKEVKDGKELINSNLECIFQKRKYLFHISSKQKESVDMAPINQLANIFETRVK